MLVDYMIEFPYRHQSGKLPSSLAGVPFLTSVSSDCLDQVLEHTSIVECNADDILIEEGQDVRAHFFILVKGSVQILKEGEEVERCSESGALIGEQALLKNEGGAAQRTATVRAVNHTFCIKVDPTYLDELSEVDRQAYYAVLFRFIATLLAERLSQANERIAELEKRSGGS